MLGVVWSFLRALWHVVGLLVLAVLAIEFGVEGWRRLNRRLRYRRPTRPDRAALADAYAGAEWSIAYFDEFRRKVRVEWRAYVEWWHRPFRGTYVTLDKRGLRRTPGEETADDGAVRILCFGGSTMMGMGARDDQTIPAVLTRRLGELGHRVAVTNYGQLGHNSTQEVITLQQLLKAGQPIDIAVFYDGINEMACAEQTGRADGLFNEERRRAEFNLLHPDRRRDLLVAALIMMAPRTLRRLRQLTGLALRGPLPALEADLSCVDVPRLADDVVGRLCVKLASGAVAGSRIWVSTAVLLATGDHDKAITDTRRAALGQRPHQRLRRAAKSLHGGRDRAPVLSRAC